MSDPRRSESPHGAVWHIVTCEYPPDVGGVADHTRLVAAGLAGAGDRVHVWCAGRSGATAERSGVVVHRSLGTFSPADLRRVDVLLTRCAPPRRLLVQWVPHGYGYRAMNLGFCLWLWRRARVDGDDVELMVHEPFLEFAARSWRQSAAAAVHRVMTAVLLRAARRIWMSTPSWGARLRPYAGRLPLRWLPVPSNVPVVADADAVASIRARYAPDGEFLAGHFGTYDRQSVATLAGVTPALLAARRHVRVLLLGRGGERVRDAVVRARPDLGERVHAPGTLPLEDVSRHLGACDAMLQPYPDGVSTRRTSVMAALAHGLPVLTTAGRLTEPLWAARGAVALAPAGDGRALVAAAGALVDDAGRRAHLAAAARSLYEECFAARHVITALRGAA